MSPPLHSDLLRSAVAQLNGSADWNKRTGGTLGAKLTCFEARAVVDELTALRARVAEVEKERDRLRLTLDCHIGVASQLQQAERERDEAREISRKYEDRYFTANADLAASQVAFQELREEFDAALLKFAQDVKALGDNLSTVRKEIAGLAESWLHRHATSLTPTDNLLECRAELLRCCHRRR